MFLTPDYLAPIEGVSAAQLQQDLQAGETLLQIAGTAYSSSEGLATAILAPFKNKMDRAVAVGQLTADKVQQHYIAARTSVETLVVTPHPLLATSNMYPQKDASSAPPDGGSAGPNVKAIVVTTLATACHTTLDALGAALQTGGKSVLAICEATDPGATVDSLTPTIISAATGQYDVAIQQGTATADQKRAALAILHDQIVAWLTTPITAQSNTIRG